jgi:hypothetical protein
MHGLLSSNLLMTLAFTIAAFFVMAFKLGAGFFLYLAALGPAAAWLVPGLVAQAMPAGLLGGTLMAAAGPRGEAYHVRAGEVLGFACAATLLSLYLVGWLAPEGFRATSDAMRPFQQNAVERPAAPPAALDMLDLVAERSEPARVELRRRLTLVISCAAAGIIAAAMVASRLVWSIRTALGVAAAAFIWQMQRWVGT